VTDKEHDHTLIPRVESESRAARLRRGGAQRSATGALLREQAGQRDGSSGNLRRAVVTWSVFCRAALQCATLAPWSCTLLWAATAMLH
jgi:hypothetical protein